MASFLGMAWTVTTFFVVPIIVMEKADPITAARRSASILKKTWGESLGANCGLGLVHFFATIAVLALIAGALSLVAGSGVGFLLGITLFISVLALVLLTLVFSALQTIINSAVYLYAAEGAESGHFDKQLIQKAFEKKK